MTARNSCNKQSNDRKQNDVLCIASPASICVGVVWFLRKWKKIKIERERETTPPPQEREGGSSTERVFRNWSWTSEILLLNNKLLVHQIVFMDIVPDSVQKVLHYNLSRFYTSLGIRDNCHITMTVVELIKHTLAEPNSHNGFWFYKDSSIAITYSSDPKTVAEYISSAVACESTLCSNVHSKCRGQEAGCKRKPWIVPCL